MPPKKRQVIEAKILSQFKCRRKLDFGDLGEQHFQRGTIIRKAAKSLEQMTLEGWIIASQPNIDSSCTALESWMSSKPNLESGNASKACQGLQRSLQKPQEKSTAKPFKQTRVSDLLRSVKRINPTISKGKRSRPDLDTTDSVSRSLIQLT